MNPDDFYGLCFDDGQTFHDSDIIGPFESPQQVADAAQRNERHNVIVIKQVIACHT